jgi:peptide/nickel transport system substrate-binding protein
MLSRRRMIATTAAGVAASSLAQQSEAATPANILVMAKTIDSIVGAFDPAESYETANNEACGNIYRKLIVPDRPTPTSWWAILPSHGRSPRTVWFLPSNSAPA